MRDRSLNDARWQILAILVGQDRHGRPETNAIQIQRVLRDLGHPVTFEHLCSLEILGYLEAQHYVRVRREPGPGGIQRLVSLMPHGVQVFEGRRKDPGVGLWAEDLEAT